MKPSLARLLLAAVLVSSTNMALAQITVPNFSFESDAVNDNSTTTTTPTSWTFSSAGSVVNRGVHDPVNAQYAGSTGNDAALPGTASGGQTGYLFVFQESGSTAFGALTQTGLATVAANTDYTLTVALGDRLDVTPSSDLSIVLAITVGGVTKASQTIATTSLSNGTFVDGSVVYSAAGGDVGGSLGISLRLEAAAGNNNSFFTANFDNVRLVATPVPEPSLYASAAAVGLLGWAALRRFKVRSASKKA